MTERETLKKWLDESSNIVFFGGAGVSTESHIPDFRSTDGLYNQEYDYPPETILSHSFYMRKPEEFFKFYRDKMLCDTAKPNAAHLKLAELEQAGKLKAVITQNIDNLHQMAGSKKVLELHGSVYRNYCMKCHRFYDFAHMKASTGVPRCECGGIIKPDVVLYEEGLDNQTIDEAVKAISEAQVLIIGGTSLAVYPAAGLIDYFRGEHLVVINKSPTPRIGFDRRVDAETYAAAVADHTICDLLRDHPIAAGDVFFLPAGRVHSIGAGAFIAEIQQTSDLTYRIYDYDRPGPDGKPRELHTELAKEAIDYTVPDDYRTHYERIRNKDTELVACPYFTTHLCDATFSVLCDYSALDSFVVLIFVAGAGELVDSEGNRVAVRQGETVLIPASTRQVTLLPGHGGLRFLSSYFWDGRGIDDQRLCRIGKVVGDQVHIVFIMNDGSFIVQLFRQTRRGLVVTGHLLSLRKEIADQGTHPDPAGSNKIDSRYIVYIHIFLFVTILYYKDTIFLSYLL